MEEKGGDGRRTVFFSGEERVGLIAGHYLPKLPRHTNIRIKAAPTTPASPRSMSYIRVTAARPLENELLAPPALLLLLTVLARACGPADVEGCSFRFPGDTPCLEIFCSSANGAFMFSLDPLRAFLRARISFSGNWMVFIRVGRFDRSSGRW